MHFTDLTSKTIGDWLVIGQAPSNRFGHRAWFCRCICGVEKSVLAAHLKTGQSTGCGCSALARRTKHGMRKQPFYPAWSDMIRRCRSPSHTRWRDYGGRGITVCEEWLDPVKFWRDMGPTYKPGLTIERVDVNGNYEPANCVWIPLAAQAANRRPVDQWRAKPSGRPRGGAHEPPPEHSPG